MGFTLIEALVSLMILSVAIIPAYAISTSSVGLAYSIRNSTTASNLAQEGVEVVRAIRDANWFSGQAFDYNLPGDGDRYIVSWNSSGVSPWYDVPLKMDANGVYNYTSGADSIFQRTITLTGISSVQLKVESEVTWTERGRAKSIRVESHLFDWK